MTESSGVNDPGSYDVAVYAAMMDRIIKTGYQVGFLDELEVLADPAPHDLTVLVSTGGSWVKGIWHLNPEVKTLTFDAAHATLDRIDRVLVRRNGTTSTTIVVLKGEAAASPVAPSLSSSLTGNYDIVLADVLIAHGTTAITQGMITDKRLSAECGPVACPLGPFTIDPATGNLVSNGKSIVLGGGVITGSGAPQANTDLDTVGARDAAIATFSSTLAIEWKQHVRVATTANGTLASAFANGQTVDGVTLATGDRILLRKQTSGAENGIYIVAASGAPARATDYNTSALILGSSIPVLEGTINKGEVYRNTNTTAISVGSTALTFTSLLTGLKTTTAGTVKTLLTDATEYTASGTVVGAVTQYHLAAYPLPFGIAKGSVIRLTIDTYIAGSGGNTYGLTINAGTGGSGIAALTSFDGATPYSLSFAEGAVGLTVPGTSGTWVSQTYADITVASDNPRYVLVVFYSTGNTSGGVAKVANATVSIGSATPAENLV
jgi:hypothetical protein